MLIEIIEQYWIDIEKVPIWKWLNIQQSKWSNDKKNGIRCEYITKILTYVNIESKTEKGIIHEFINQYYEKIK